MWNKICEKVFLDCVDEFKKNHIRYFVLRNYELLPEQNTSKDVDIIVEPGTLKKAVKILKMVYKKNGITNCYQISFSKLHCVHGMSMEMKTGIHIDLIEGYLVKGYELFSFEELYSHTMEYKGFVVMDPFFDGIMLLIYKQFGYKKPELKQRYQKTIRKTVENYPKEFRKQLEKVTSQELAEELIKDIQRDDFERVVSKAAILTRQLKKYAFKRKPFITSVRMSGFFFQKIWRIVFRYRKHARVFAVLAPDGTGKTTFIEALEEILNLYYVNNPSDHRTHVYHFRPAILPNLGEVGEKAGVMEQDKNWTNPHRGKAANPLSSLVRIAYYTLDYIIGWAKYVRNDVHYDRHVLFDRYSYDFIVDPLRTKLGLPKWVRKFFVRLTPQPKVVFVLDADTETIYSRKQELTKEEITRQLGLYRELTDSHKRFHKISALQTPEEMANEAMKIILNTYTERL